RVRSVTQITIAAAALLYRVGGSPCGPALGGSARETETTPCLRRNRRTDARFGTDRRLSAWIGKVLHWEAARRMVTEDWRDGQHGSNKPHCRGVCRDRRSVSGWADGRGGGQVVQCREGLRF